MILTFYLKYCAGEPCMKDRKNSRFNWSPAFKGFLTHFYNLPVSGIFKSFDVLPLSFDVMVLIKYCLISLIWLVCWLDFTWKLSCLVSTIMITVEEYSWNFLPVYPQRNNNDDNDVATVTRKRSPKRPTRWNGKLKSFHKSKCIWFCITAKSQCTLFLLC